MGKFDFSGWATRNDLLCGDGRTIRKNAFAGNDGQTVPLIWNHDHANPKAVIGHALLENRDDGVYAYCTLNDTESGQHAKELVQHGDVRSLSIYANKLKQVGGDVIHGTIRELSLVLAGANPGAFIDSVMAHGDEEGEAMWVNYDENAIYLYHSDEPKTENTNTKEKHEDKLSHADSERKEKSMAEETKKPEINEDEETIADVFNTLNEKQKTAVYAVIGAALEEAGVSTEEGDEDMKHNVFENDYEQDDVLTHADQEMIINMAKSSGVGSLREAMDMYAEDNSLQHDAFDDMTALFPEYALIDPAEPKVVYDDDGWVEGVINGVHKSPIARVRTRRADARKSEIETELKGKGYKKGTQKKLMDKIKLVGRTHDAQTVYVKDTLNRDDILDITDFDVVNYQWKIMRHTMDQTIAQAILVGDGREDIDPDKIKEDHIRPIWKDDDLYCIHQDVDFAKAKAELQGGDTNKNFGENYIYAEAIITAALYAREKYKGSGNLTFYCTPHALNVMLLARDLNGRRIYSSKNDLVAALNVKDIKTVEQFEGLERETKDGKTKKMLGLFVNLADYQVGCVRGGEITRFDQFDIDFNQQKLLMETRLSGALVEWYSAIALEEDVTTPTVSDDHSSIEG